jgi:LPPG:FO 2-phospho-L-lactate transferase
VEKNEPMICVLAGGVGAARFLRGLVREVDPASVTAVVNTGDDTILHGLRISPDLDTVTYTLADAIDPVRQWGLRDESWNMLEALRRYEGRRPQGSSAASTWFGLGDRDLATHLYRTARLAEGALLSDITTEIAQAWGVGISIVPMTNDRVETMVDVLDDGDVRRITFQEYFVRHRHAVPIRGVDFVGATEAVPACLEVLASAETIVIAPSNPIVSIGPIRALDGVDRVLRDRRDHVVAVSPIIAGGTVKGPADRMMAELGLEASVTGVARLYAEICGTLIIDERDAHLRDDVERAGLRCIVTDTMMDDVGVAARLARTAIDATS